MLDALTMIVVWSVNVPIVLSWFMRSRWAVAVYEACLPYIWVAEFLVSVLNVFRSDMPGVVVGGLLSILWYYIWRWSRRDKKRQPSRVLGLIVDLGHRLTVRPQPVSTS